MSAFRMSDFKPFEYLTAIVIRVLLFAMAHLPFQAASNTGAWIARAIGPRLAISRKADRNLKYIFPNWDDAARRETMVGVWDNLGRNFAEYPQLHGMRFDGTDVRVSGDAAATDLIGRRPIVFLVGHTGNWEILPHFWGKKSWPVMVMYRTANNRYVDAVIQKYRAQTNLQFVPKGKKGSRGLIENLAANRAIAVLMDQKMSDGEEIAFLGKPAMTGVGWARLALKFNAAIIPARTVRYDNSSGAGAPKFGIVFEQPILPENLNLPQDDPSAASLQLAQMANDIYGRWIAEIPGQWLWLHRRWGRLP